MAGRDHLLPKLNVASSNPVSRSILLSRLTSPGYMGRTSAALQRGDQATGEGRVCSIGGRRPPID
jgi:hypothetical protein